MNGRWDARALVDLKRGVVSRELFVNDAIYEQEQGLRPDEQTPPLFRGCWAL